MAKFFINRPIVAMVISILTVIVGIVSMLRLPIAQFPEIIPPEVNVRATFPGADAQTLVQSVATPIEQQIVGVDNMNYMYSVNSNAGMTAITVNFDVTTDPNIDQVLTQLRTALAQPQLPVEVTTAGLTVQKSLASPLLLVAIYSPNGTYDASFLANYAYINLVDELSRMPGVGRVQVFGAGQYSMRIWVKPDQMAKLGVTVPQIVSAIRTQSTVNPAGQIGGEPIPRGQEFTYTVRAKGRLTTPEEFGDILLRASRDGSILRLKDVARIELGAQSYASAGRFNKRPAANMAIYQLPGSNSVDAADAVRNRLIELKKRFPADLDYRVAVDTTRAVRSGIREIAETLFEALLLVVLVVYLFLQSWRATMIPMLAVPVSLVGTFMVFPLLGFSINTLSLFGLVLAIGLVVDDAIVVVEAIEHHMEEGMAPRDAALQAMHEVSGPVVAIAVILAAVFVPTVFIPGITGRLYQQFAVTVAISVMISAFNALSLSPALGALLLKPQKAHGPLAGFFGWFNRNFQRTRDGYVGFSAVLVRKAGFSFVFLALVTGAVLLTGRNLPASFLPEEDNGYVMATLQLPDAASLQRTSAAAAKIEDFILNTPGVEGCIAVMGFNILSQVPNPYSGFFFVPLKPWDERKLPEEQYQAIRRHIMQGLAKVPEGVAISFPPPPIPGIGTFGGVSFVLEDRSGAEPEFLNTNLDKFLKAARKRPELANVSTTHLPTIPQIYADVDREKVARQGVNLGDVYTTMQSFMGGYMVNYFNLFGRQWQVYVAAEGDYRRRPEDISQFYVTDAGRGMVPLGSVVNTRTILGPEFMLRYNQYQAAQVNALAAPGYSAGQARKALETAFAETMPREMGFDYLGMSFQEQKAEQGISAASIFGLSLLFVFLILSALYESWSLPLSVLLGVPIAAFGGYMALYLRNFENDVYTQIGLIMLIGLSAKNAILIVEFAKSAYEKGGKTVAEAALIGARLRFRPILMTSLAFVFGCIPLWTATGAGAASRRILGTVVIGGMLAATSIAIFLIPMTFDVIESFSLRFKGKHAALPGEEER
ncbi:MAG: multidrug efflux RND transporter permease subunit [Acidobacteriales bacterium]|nr:multidrug efflux RND transporter permease subunit [Terriglobales bacterium]